MWGLVAFLKVKVCAGRVAPARDYVRGLPDWFHSHLLTMDAALAGCLKQQDMAAPQHTPAA